MHYCTAVKALDLVIKLNSGKASANDELSMKILNSCAHVSAQFVLVLTNISVSLEVLPDDLEIAI